jgi:hypothetical protein
MWRQDTMNFHNYFHHLTTRRVCRNSGKSQLFFFFVWRKLTNNGVRTKTNSYQNKLILVAGTITYKGDIWKFFQTISLLTHERANKLMSHFLEMYLSYSSKRGSLSVFLLGLYSNHKGRADEWVVCYYREPVRFPCIYILTSLLSVM